MQKFEARRETEIKQNLPYYNHDHYRKFVVGWQVIRVIVLLTAQ